MKDLKQKMKGIQAAPLMLALLVFFQSTAGTILINRSKPVLVRTMTLANYTNSINELEEPDVTPLQVEAEQDPQGGGPDQPEVQSFTPVGISDMVDPFTGDFSYSLPIMDVDGYPINLAYSGGAQMDQEASWVGLGWNLNPGVMNRSLRGLPDDFNGSDSIVTEMNQKKNWTMGVNFNNDLELFGFHLPLLSSIGIPFNMIIDYDNFQGFSSTISGNLSTPIKIPKMPGELDASLGFSFSNASGATLSPSMKYTNSDPNSDAIIRRMNIGANFNSRQGLKVQASLPSLLLKNSTANSKRKIAQKALNFASSYISTSSFNIGCNTYSPKISMPLNTFSTNFTIKTGPDVVGNDLSFNLGASYSCSWLRVKKLSNPAFGYSHLGEGQYNKHALLDFSRENDGAITKHTPALAIPSLNYDVFSASGHGVGGSYRPVRREVGFLFDPKQKTNSVATDFDFESNFGSILRIGTDVKVNTVSTKSGVWEDFQNNAIDNLGFSSERVEFQEANELSVENDPNHLDGIGGEHAVKFDYSLYQGIKNKLVNSSNEYDSPNYEKSGKTKRNQLTTTITNEELRKGMGVQRMHTSNYAYSRTNLDHHVGQFTVLNTEGSRYIYGIAAYNHNQSNVSFSVTNNPLNSNGMVPYDAGTDNSTNNSKGTDNFFNKETTPAYAHSYLLTSILNPDYVDADTTKGPSIGDLGGYLKLDYFKVDNFLWRTPITAANHASHDEGFHTDINDDKGHYSNGEKELWYLTTIRSKNHVAVFHTSSRADGNSMDENGNLITTGPKMMKLDSISLFSAPDYDAHGLNATPIKVAHFVYDYSLCKNYPLNSNAYTNNGKLTLKKVYFTYERSHKGRFSAYKFGYDHNPDYHPKSTDRWGVYKPYPANYNGNVSSSPLRPSDFPYVGFNKTAVDVYAASWNLTDIQLPSGGKIEVDYESDDYAFVQHKRANQMFKIIAVEGSGGTKLTGDVDLSSSIDPTLVNSKLFFELSQDENGNYNTNINDYIPEDNLIYYRALLKFGNNHYDFVPGYAEIESIGISTMNSTPVGVIKFKPGKLKDNGNEVYNPIAIAGIQFGRLHLNKFIPPSNTIGDANTSGFSGTLLDLGNSIFGAFSSMSELFLGPNTQLWLSNIGTKLTTDRSWIRLQNPDEKKLGGGYRVKQIRIYDSWDTLTNQQMQGFYYGQEYKYVTSLGKSSGVAAYEPQLGGDENPFQKPAYFSKRLLLAPDESNYQIEPFGEQFFPSATVGYSSVTIQNLQRTGVTRTATGKVVHEFYTAKDFPTIVERTELQANPNKILIPAYFMSYCVDQLVASQGFTVQINDMHGKQKAEYVYAEGQSSPQSSVVYKYKSTNLTYDGKLVRQLSNKVTTISKNGSVNTGSRIGLQYEAFADFRKSLSQAVSGELQFNINLFTPFLSLPTGYGQYSYERTAMRSATFTKVIERFGLLDTTIATDDHSIVRTENLAYDAETGAVILTKTQTDFNDAVYNLTFPAHWYYDRMGQAYLNTDFEMENVYFVSGGSNLLNNTNLVKGDEVLLKATNGTMSLAWVTDISSNGAKFQYKDGSLVNGEYDIRILRSGRRNTQMTPIGTITLRTNPLTTISTNFYDDVLQASATEFSEDWRTFCECFATEGEGNYTTNPYVRGLKGTWRPLTSYVHLTGRTQAYVNQNTNIRDDGFMTSFSPFYKWQNGAWNIDRQNWTFTSKVSEFSPFGQALETVDPLNRYTSSIFGYNQTLATAVAANTRYRQLGYDGFEDYGFQNCSDNHFRIADGNTNKLSNEAHTGKYSIKVSSTDNVYLNKSLEYSCETPNCNIIKNDNTVTNGDNSTTQTISFSNGKAPYIMDIQVINGTPNYQLNTDGNGITIPNATASYRVKIQVTDANGCVQYFQINR